MSTQVLEFNSLETKKFHFPAAEYSFLMHDARLNQNLIKIHWNLLEKTPRMIQVSASRVDNHIVFVNFYLSSSTLIFGVCH